MIKLSEDDTKELLRLYDRANNTPLIKFTSDFEEKDFSQLAHDRLDNFMKKMAEKYNYDYRTNAINGKGEVVPI